MLILRIKDILYIKNQSRLYKVGLCQDGEAILRTAFTSSTNFKQKACLLFYYMIPVLKLQKKERDMLV